MSIPEHEHWYHVGERRCGFTVDAGRCEHWLPPAGYGALDGEGRYCCEKCDPPPVPFWARQHDIPADPDDTSDPWISGNPPVPGSVPVTRDKEEA